MYWAAAAAVQPEEKCLKLCMEKRTLLIGQSCELWFLPWKRPPKIYHYISTNSWQFGLVPGSRMPGWSSLSLFGDNIMAADHTRSTLPVCDPGDVCGKGLLG